MASLESCEAKTRLQPYRSVRDDPRYPKLKKVIDGLPRHKREYLKSYLEQYKQGGWSVPDRE